jgi:hypothetical protein
MEYKNSKQIIDTINSKRDILKILKDKAAKCGKENEEIGKIQSECFDIFKLVMRNFSSTRKELDIWVLNDYYNDSKKFKSKVLIGKKNVPKDGSWYYNELCLNNTGFSLLSDGGIKSSSILEERRDGWVSNIIKLKDKSIQGILKESLREEKFEILQKVLNGIEVLKYEDEMLKEKELKYSVCDFHNGNFNIKEVKTKFMKFRADGLRTQCYVLKDKNTSYEDTDITPQDLNYESIVMIEQLQEELLIGFDEYYIHLNEQKKKMKDYFTQLKQDFTKELIVMALNKSNGETK